MAALFGLDIVGLNNFQTSQIKVTVVSQPETGSLGTNQKPAASGQLPEASKTP
jgi:hypothetical protein